MNASFKKDVRIWKKSSAWLIDEYAGQVKRMDLLNRYNSAIGEPSLGVARVQDDFLNDRMDPAEVVAFVGICEKLIAAFRSR